MHFDLFPDSFFLGLQHETELLEDSLALSGFPLSTACRFGTSEDDEFMDSDELTTTQTCTGPAFTPHPRYTESNIARAQAVNIKQEARRHGWLHKLVTLLDLLCCVSYNQKHLRLFDDYIHCFFCLSVES